MHTCMHSLAGKVKPEAFMAYRMNGQYILEGISGAMMYTLGGAPARGWLAGWLLWMACMV